MVYQRISSGHWKHFGEYYAKLRCRGLYGLFIGTDIPTILRLVRVNREVEHHIWNKSDL